MNHTFTMFYSFMRSEENGDYQWAMDELKKVPMDWDSSKCGAHNEGNQSFPEREFVFVTDRARIAAVFPNAAIIL
ncbi:hypothetical protein PsorP6_006843 [Peronosclerospora sorghi]|uniref:Uncharacterized protein n=1 Tax=Peronosclerospora sorghi TaxID=230839 RepID=A0ACC0W9F6_9STRA|nr:hypothetical protein PsorP6_006843 [Peronosclerospora sorghi]